MSAKDSAGVIAPPPLIFGGALILAWVARNLIVFKLFPRPYNISLGVGFVLLGSLLALVTSLTLIRAKTALNPYRATTKVITSGPFRISRNPIYLGLTLAYLGVAIALDLMTAIALLPLVILLMNWGVISREEAYLETRFGEEYLRYKANVRRWL